MIPGQWPTTPPTFLALDPVEHSFERAAWVALPVPYEATTSYRKGTQDGPGAIIRASAEMEDYDPELGFEPCRAGIHTAAPLEPALGGPGAMAERVAEAVGACADAGKRVAMLGGEHSISSGAVAALAARHPGLSVLVFDAQADLRDEYQGSRHSHACATRRMLDHAPAAIVGVRSMTADEAAFAAERGAPLFPRGPEPITDADAIVGALSADVYVRPRRVRPVVHGRRRHAGAGRTRLVGSAAAAPRRGVAQAHRRVRRRRTVAGGGAGVLRLHRRQARLQAHRLRGGVRLPAPVRAGG